MSKYFFKDIKILCLEDDLLMAKNLVSTLREIGFTGEIIHCENGVVGTKVIAEKGYDYFDFVISDMVMPELDGLGFVEHLRKFNSKVPVLMLTSIFTKEVILDCVMKGASDYVSKPVEKVLLAQKMVSVYI